MLHKRYEKMGKLPSHFNIINKSLGGSAFKPFECEESVPNGNTSLDFAVNLIKFNDLPANENQATPVKKNLINSFNDDPASPA